MRFEKLQKCWRRSACQPTRLAGEVTTRDRSAKAQIIGAGHAEDKEIRVLNRVISLTDKGYRLEVDPRHAEHVMRDLGLEGAKGGRPLALKNTVFRLKEEMSSHRRWLLLSRLTPGETTTLNKPYERVIHIPNGWSRILPETEATHIAMIRSLCHALHNSVPIIMLGHRV